MGIVGSLAAGRLPGVRLPVTGGAASDTPVDPDAAALIARMTVQPDSARKALITKTITDLKSAGLWAKISVLYFYAAHDGQAAQLNWKADAFLDTPQNSPLFTVDRGYQGDGSSSYLDNSWNPQADPLYLQNSSSFGVYVNLAGNGGGSDTIIEMGGANAFLISRSSAGNLRGRVNQGTTTDYGALSPLDRVGFSVFTREDAASSKGYKNGVLNATVTATSSALPNEMWISLGRRIGGAATGLSAQRHACKFAGAGMTETEVAQLNTIVSNYLTPLGAA